MKKLLFLVCAIVATTTTLSAKQPTGKDSTEYIARYRVAVEKMFEASGSKSTMTDVMDQVLQIASSQAQVKDSAQLKVVMTILKESMSGIFEEIVEMMIPIYQKHISLDDIEYFTSIYDTPQGKRMKDATPLITKDLMPVMMQWSMNLQQKVIAALEKAKAQQQAAE